MEALEKDSLRMRSARVTRDRHKDGKLDVSQIECRGPQEGEQ